MIIIWEGNIQFIGEKSSFLTYYVTKYMNKPVNYLILSSKNDKNKRAFFGFTNNRECGALEAADTLLGIPLYGTDPTIRC